MHRPLRLQEGDQRREIIGLECQSEQRTGSTAADRHIESSRGIDQCIAHCACRRVNTCHGRRQYI